MNQQSSTSAVEGFISFREHQVWYRIVKPNQEAEDKLPLLCIHGGPGVPHDYLEPLEAIANTGRQVIFYDQLGCGNSDRPTDANLYSIDLFKDELIAIRSTLNLEQIHLFGQSWGGCLALEHTLSQATGLASLILANTPANIQQFVSEAYKLMNDLPAEIKEIISKHETAGTTQQPEYKQAMEVFNHSFLCRLNPWPSCLTKAYSKVGTEFRGAGKIIDWSLENRLSEIFVPTLLLSGRYDEVTPACVEKLKQGISDSEWVLFENSSHMPHLEETERFLQVLDEFLTRVEHTRDNPRLQQ
ncbi:MAG: proline iminopeptidase-family hydrolase [Brasilonema octagenarum HA4186-MV1]|jgi:proline-specific peptidase|uniref:Proline iminopeptidase n=1 Tax=Brasilonema sennae CENA114 TaxID=415709 RepID=A0A856MAJ1_9CYAN|nr:proline iminopeptidase-family hydrolase [Brasilonema sennae]MBW4627638.1 proline iminopeptidase-family hydrolase [Brasilonema octagenarum HA4186-MV1]QDL08163.1 alpha/beta hydrolase [Brasilonema sennae CENA114]QDL14521.1 alpha/beta hydrolase [Brasilonema octagenarum UFV-E1]